MNSSPSQGLENSSTFLIKDKRKVALCLCCPSHTGVFNMLEDNQENNNSSSRQELWTCHLTRLHAVRAQQR